MVKNLSYIVRASLPRRRIDVSGSSCATRNQNGKEDSPSEFNDDRLSHLEQETHFRIDRCLTCFDGKMTLDAVQYETGLRRNHLRDLLTIFKEDVSPA
jgi:hypothetical protein